MRLLHTSDWHLGRSFPGVGMLEHQAAFLDHLLDVVERESVDVVVVSGDVYDRALPPVDAVELLQTTLERLAASRARVVISSGNHDSHLRLGFASRLIDGAGVHLRTHARDVGTPVVIGDVAFYAIPYLDPDHLREPWGLSARSHAAALTEAMRRVRVDLSGRSTRSVVLAHAFVAGGESSDSERDISVGGVQRVPVSTFDGVDYVALGHLHGAHTLTERIRYSGSPLAYSFSEADQRKGSWLVDLAADGSVQAEFVEAPVPRPLARIEGGIEELLADPSYGAAEPAWVQAVITDAERPSQAKLRLERRFPHLLSLNFRPEGGLPAPVPGVGDRPRTDHEITLDFVREMRGRSADDVETLLLRDAVEAGRPDHEADRRAVS